VVLVRSAPLPGLERGVDEVVRAVEVGGRNEGTPSQPDRASAAHRASDLAFPLFREGRFCSDGKMISLPGRALLVSILLILVTCNEPDSDSRASVEPSISPAGTETPESVPSPTESMDSLPPGVKVTSQGGLEPGKYQTSLFEPHLSFKVPRGWQVAFEGGNHIVLARRLEPNDEVIYLDSSQQMVDVRDALRYAQDAFVGTTGNARDFRFSDANEIRIGAFRGRGISMEVATDQPVVTLALGIEAYELRPDDRLELNAISVDGETVLLFVEAPGSRFDAFLQAARPVLESLDL